ncbi:hypothetical protein NNO07_18740 [Pseudomonas resinovorans]|uniref:Uncharacterized protein n=1 Tax=Metapseudomonas resinovorans TaxID=53412 RepID=A0ABT4Y8A0_METRE|nr:hypothetical protein [Pseudomonas resinovorans]MDA8485108.1 hypothetical protein [Pseudomonas resinovorans]
MRKKATSAYGTINDHIIDISRESEEANWYIVVTAPCGMRDYDGWWADSADKTIEEALAEAVNGSCLFELPDEDEEE